MSGRSRRWVCCSAAVVLVVLSGWWAADASASHPAVTADAAGASALAGTTGDVASLHNRRVVAEPAAAKRVEIERLVAVMVAAMVAVIAVAGSRLPGTRPAIRNLRNGWGLRSRGPPLSFVS